MSATMSGPRAAVERYLDALNSHDPDAIAACVTADFVNEHTSARGTTRHGRDAYRAALPDFLARFVDLHYAVEDVVVEGDRAVVAYRMTCEWVDDDGHRHPVALRGVFRFAVADGLIAHRVDYWDGSDFERQVLR
jgi:ketosteroid isomerase-like protein